MARMRISPWRALRVRVSECYFYLLEKDSTLQIASDHLKYPYCS